jgi:hypothetical protein
VLGEPPERLEDCFLGLVCRRISEEALGLVDGEAVAAMQMPQLASAYSGVVSSRYSSQVTLSTFAVCPNQPAAMAA